MSSGVYQQGTESRVSGRGGRQGWNREVDTSPFCELREYAVEPRHVHAWIESRVSPVLMHLFCRLVPCRRETNEQHDGVTTDFAGRLRSKGLMFNDLRSLLVIFDKAKLNEALAT